MQGEKNSRKSKEGNKCRINNHRFKKLKLKREKKKERKTPQNFKANHRGRDLQKQ